MLSFYGNGSLGVAVGRVGCRRGSWPLCSIVMMTFDVASGTTVRLNAIGILGRHTGTVNNGVDAKYN